MISKTTAPFSKASKRIAFYISSHGYGHAARSTVLLQKLVPNYDIQIKTTIPKKFFTECLGKDILWIRQNVDVGCIQKNYSDVDAERTFKQYRHFLRNHSKRLRDESNWLIENNIDLVISDIASFPLKAAKIIGLPSFLIANFTWYDIFSKLSGAKKHRDLLNILHEEYSSATTQFLPQFALSNNFQTPKEIVGFISLKGQSRRNELEQQLSVKDKVLVFIYLGNYDISFIKWENLKLLDDYAFITRDPHLNPPENLYVLDGSFSYADLIASADLVVSKCGYSTLASAFHHGKPVVACDRKDFCEAVEIRNFIVEKKVGVIIPQSSFNLCDWGIPIKEAMNLTVKNKVHLRGEDTVVKEIDKFLET